MGRLLEGGAYYRATLIKKSEKELSSLLHVFLQADEENRLICQVTGKRKREIGLVAPAKFSPFTKTKRIAIKLDEELKKRKEMLTYVTYTLLCNVKFY